MKLNNRGFTITELIVSSAIGIILAGIATFAFIEAISLFNRSVRQYQAETDMLGAMISIKSTFSRSISVKYGGAASGATDTYSRRVATTAQEMTNGALFRYSTAAAGTGVRLIGLVNREMGGNTLADNSNFQGVGVYYQTFSTSPHKSGALYVDTEKTNAPPFGWAKVSPVNAVLGFGRFVEFATENIRVLNTDGSMTMDAGAGDVGKPVLSADFRLVVRYFTKVIRNTDYRWCPSAQISGNPDCQSNALFYDIEKRVKVVFANNAFTSTTVYPQRPYGNIYFFKSVTPLTR